MSPEDKSSKTQRWKAGYYWIAQQAGGPIGLTWLDDPSKLSGIGSVLWPTGVGAGGNPRLFAGEVAVFPTAPSGGSSTAREDAPQPKIPLPLQVMRSGIPVKLPPPAPAR